MQGRNAAKTATHRRIVSSAGRLMRRRGLTGASVADVMRGAGLTVGGFYAHFRSKRAMDLEVLEQAFADVREASMARQGDARGLDWLARYVGHYLDGRPSGSPRRRLPRAGGGRRPGARRRRAAPRAGDRSSNAGAIGSRRTRRRPPASRRASARSRPSPYVWAASRSPAACAGSR